MNSLYPEIKPFATDYLSVSDGHKVYYEQYGNINGKPALFVHGGPGGGTQPDYARFFDPTEYWIILVDQRGSGQSTPHASLEANNTQLLVEDFEILRKKLAIKQWMLFGGSWGSTLSLVYAINHPEVVSELVLRGIFLGRPFEQKWLFEAGGASRIFMDEWSRFTALVDKAKQSNMLEAYYEMLTGTDETLKLKAAKALTRWELSISVLKLDELKLEAALADDAFCLAMARIEVYYMKNNMFLPSNYILNSVDAIKGIPLTIVQGRYDIVCPMQSAWELSCALPDSDLKIIPDAGHSIFEPGIVDALVVATQKYAGLEKVK